MICGRGAWHLGVHDARGGEDLIEERPHVVLIRKPGFLDDAEGPDPRVDVFVLFDLGEGLDIIDRLHLGSEVLPGPPRELVPPHGTSVHTGRDDLAKRPGRVLHRSGVGVEQRIQPRDTRIGTITLHVGTGFAHGAKLGEPGTAERHVNGGTELDVRTEIGHHVLAEIRECLIVVRGSMSAGFGSADLTEHVRGRQLGDGRHDRMLRVGGEAISCRDELRPHLGCGVGVEDGSICVRTERHEELRDVIVEHAALDERVAVGNDGSGYDGRCHRGNAVLRPAEVHGDKRLSGRRGGVVHAGREDVESTSPGSERCEKG